VKISSASLPALHAITFENEKTKMKKTFIAIFCQLSLCSYNYPEVYYYFIFLYKMLERLHSGNRNS